MQLTSGTLGQYFARFWTRASNDSGSPMSQTSSVAAILPYLHKVNEAGTTTWRAKALGGLVSQSKDEIVTGVISDKGVPIILINDPANGILNTTSTPSLTIELV